MNVERTFNGSNSSLCELGSAVTMHTALFGLLCAVKVNEHMTVLSVLYFQNFYHNLKRIIIYHN